MVSLSTVEVTSRRPCHYPSCKLSCKPTVVRQNQSACIFSSHDFSPRTCASFIKSWTFLLPFFLPSLWQAHHTMPMETQSTMNTSVPGMAIPLYLRWMLLVFQLSAFLKKYNRNYLHLPRRELLHPTGFNNAQLY